MPVARRVLGKSNEITLRMRWNYAEALRRDDGATLDDLREAVTTLEDAERTARRVFGGAHPVTGAREDHLRYALAALRACEEADAKSRREDRVVETQPQPPPPTATLAEAPMYALPPVQQGGQLNDLADLAAGKQRIPLN